VNELRTFRETRVLLDILQSSKVTSVWSTLKQTSVTEDSIISFFRLLFLFNAHTEVINTVSKYVIDYIRVGVAVPKA